MRPGKGGRRRTNEALILYLNQVDLLRSIDTCEGQKVPVRHLLRFVFQGPFGFVKVPKLFLPSLH